MRKKLPTVDCCLLTLSSLVTDNGVIFPEEEGFRSNSGYDELWYYSCAVTTVSPHVGYEHSNLIGN